MHTRFSVLALTSVLALIVAGCIETDVTTVVRPDGSAERRLRQIYDQDGEGKMLAGFRTEVGLSDYRLGHRDKWTRFTERFDGTDYVLWARYEVKPGKGSPDLRYRPKVKSPYGIDLEFENSGPRITTETRDGKPVLVYRETITARNAIALASGQLAYHLRERAKTHGVELTDAQEQAVAQSLATAKDSPEFRAFMEAYHRSMTDPNAEDAGLDTARQGLSDRGKALAKEALVAQGISREQAEAIVADTSFIASSSWEEVPYLAKLYCNAFLVRARMPGKVLETNGKRTDPYSVSWGMGGLEVFGEKIDFYAVSEMPAAEKP
jgi:hypothetical protein